MISPRVKLRSGIVLTMHHDYATFAPINPRMGSGERVKMSKTRAMSRMHCWRMKPADRVLISKVTRTTGLSQSEVLRRCLHAAGPRLIDAWTSMGTMTVNVEGKP